MEEETREYVHYTTGNGLPDNVVLGIHEDENGNLWLSTRNGLARFDPRTGHFNIYDKGDGVHVKEFHWLSSYKGKSGHMFFGGEGGLLAFHPGEVYENRTTPPVVITSFRLFNQEVPIGGDSPLKKSISLTKRMELSYKENYLSFQFAALNYLNAGKNRYKYMMEGIDPDWIDAGTNRTATYQNMKHGRYTFRVIGSNNDGIWNEEGAFLDIRIQPPPWLSWWAYVLYGLILASLVLWYRSYLIRQMKLTTALEVEHVEKMKIQELDQMKSRFFANISHEFRTPLTLILGPIEDKLKASQELDQKERGVFQVMYRNAKRLQRLINQLLDLSKLEAGESTLKVSEGDISAFTRSIAQSFLSHAESRNILYRMDIPDRAIMAYFDPSILEKILTNLISNAFKFTFEDGSVTVLMRTHQGSPDDVPESIDISIRDTGKGIPAEESEKIFERFYQVSSSDSREFEGTGIGLALCKELAEMHRGHLRVRSAPGKGSTFTIHLPCSRDQFSDEEVVPGNLDTPDPEPYNSFESGIQITAEARDQHGPVQDDTPVILIVEDNRDLREYMAHILEGQFQILEAVNGKEGLTKTLEYIPDLVITDLMMPEMDGAKLCTRLKNDGRTSHIPVIMVTVKADKESKLEGLQRGADDYLVKPFDADELKIRVRNNIEQRKRLRESFYKEFVFGESGIELTGPDERFLKRTMDLIQSHISDQDFNVRSMSDTMGISQMQLYRKVKGSTDMSPGELIRNMRLKNARILLSKHYDNISQVAYQVGFSDHSYFTKCFRELYGITPKSYANQMIGNSQDLLSW